MIIVICILSCGGDSNKNAAELWNDAQKYRTENKLKESITSYKIIQEKYPSNDLAAAAQFQVADIYLNDVKDFEYAVEEFKNVVDKYPDHEVSKKSLFMIAYVYNNYLDAYSDAIITYKIFKEKYPNDELVPSVEYELDGLKNIQSTIDSLNTFTNKISNI